MYNARIDIYETHVKVYKDAWRAYGKNRPERATVVDDALAKINYLEVVSREVFNYKNITVLDTLLSLIYIPPILCVTMFFNIVNR